MSDLRPVPVTQILAFWKPGSQGPEWTWADEYNDLIPRIAHIEHRYLTEGPDFADDEPVLLGNDGRVWDGHHRICLAIKHGTPTLNAQIVEEETCHCGQPLAYSRKKEHASEVE